MTEFEANLRRLRGEIHDFAARMRKAEVAATILEQTLMQIPARFVPGMGGMGCVTAFPALAACIPFSMPFSIGKAAFGTLTWTGSSETDTSGIWTGCVLYDRPAVGACSARTIPLFCSMIPDGPGDVTMTWRTQWITSSGTCPDSGRTCADSGLITHTNDDAGQVLFDSASGVSGAFGATAGVTDGIPNGQPSNVYINFNFNFDVLSAWLPQTFSFTDQLYGSTTLAWDGTQWTGCIPGIAYPGFAPCAAATIAIHYDVLPISGPALRLRWARSGNCPQPSTCATTTGLGSTSVGEESGALGGPFVYRFTSSGTASPLRSLYRNIQTDFTVSIP